MLTQSEASGYEKDSVKCFGMCSAVLLHCMGIKAAVVLAQWPVEHLWNIQPNLFHNLAVLLSGIPNEVYWYINILLFENIAK